MKLVQGMMMGLAVMAANVAQAEVKPENTVVPALCGEPNASERICVASNITTHQRFLVVNGVEGERIYVKLEQVSRLVKRGGGVIETLAGSTVQRDETGYARETFYELRTDENNRHDFMPTYQATLKINGKSERAGYDNFEMEHVAITQ